MKINFHIDSLSECWKTFHFAATQRQIAMEHLELGLPIGPPTLN